MKLTWFYLFLNRSNLGMITGTRIAEIIISAIAFDETIAASKAWIFPLYIEEKKTKIPVRTNTVFVKEPIKPERASPK